MAPSTLETYNKVVNGFKAFILTLDKGLDVFPVTPAHVSLYMCHLFNLGRAPSTIATKISALGYWHKVFDKPNPVDHFLIRSTLTWMRKKKPQQDKRMPLLLNSLHKMIDGLGKVQLSTYNAMMTRAMLLVSFHAFLRPGEMTKSINSIKFEKVKVKSSSAKIRMLNFKHSKGRQARVRVKALGTDYCPVRALKRFMVLRGSYKGNLFCFQDRSPVPYLWYAKVFKDLVISAGLNLALKPHSARIGAATHAAATGVPEDKIRRFGRWVSSAYRGYLRLSLLSL